MSEYRMNQLERLKYDLMGRRRYVAAKLNNLLASGPPLDEHDLMDMEDEVGELVSRESRLSAVLAVVDGRMGNRS